jgi:hypothetical protein
MNNYYVYVYLDPRKSGTFQYGEFSFEFEPFYVGKGKGRRCLEHLTIHSLSDNRNPMKNGIIRQILSEDAQPYILKLREHMTNDDALLEEIRVIALIGRRNRKTGPLTNLTDGGESTTGRICSSETKALMSSQRKGKKQTEAQYRANCSRAPMSEEHRRKISQSQIGIRRLTEEQYANIADKNRGKKRSEETRALWSKQRKGKPQTPAQYAANCAKRRNVLPYEDFKDFAKSSGKTTARGLMAFLRTINDPMIPKNPCSAYKLRNQWVSWNDLLGR